jgi:uncharacterized integral membrane protein
VAVVVFEPVLLLLLTFILENGQRSDVYFLGAHGSPPMGVALLLSAIFGVLLVTLPSAARIVQLRLVAGRRREESTRATRGQSHVMRSTMDGSRRRCATRSAPPASCSDVEHPSSLPDSRRLPCRRDRLRPRSNVVFSWAMLRRPDGALLISMAATTL